jgi:DNA-directed RNA polymerase specialized sigma24 family protein
MPAPERGAAPQPDSDSADWLASLAPDCPGRPEGLSRLHALLLRAARTELARRAPRVQVTGPELDDLAHQAAESADLLAAVRRAVEEELTSRQRQVFTALVIDGIPLDALAVRLGTSRNALYKMMFDARGKIRAALVANGYLCETTARQR